MTPLRPYLAILTLTTLATIWGGSAIVQRERRIMALECCQREVDLTTTRSRGSAVEQPFNSVTCRDENTAGSIQAPTLRQMSDAAAGLVGLDPDLFASLIRAESRWNPRAVSSVGARGLGQLMPATARLMGVTDPFDPWQNLLGSAAYLRLMIDQHGSKQAGLWAYHAGGRRVREGRVLQESRDYARQIMEGSE